MQVTKHSNDDGVAAQHSARKWVAAVAAAAAEAAVGMQRRHFRTKL